MKKLKSVLTLSLLFFFAGIITLNAQEEASIEQAVEQLQSDNEVNKRLKISGYVQAQYQSADTAGISSFAGGNFGQNIDNRMSIRRGRVKFAYTFENASAVMQFDITEKGLAIKDAYFNMTDPWTNFFTLTGGVFDRPFGYEISYSSSSRETPERSRLFQTLFPGERDLGAKLTLQAPKTSNWNFLKFDIGLVNGNGVSVETDSYKDFLLRLTSNRLSRDERFSWGIGASFYNGGFAYNTNKIFRLKEENGVKHFVSEDVKKGDKSKRQYFGVETQLGYDWAGGITQIRAEYIGGVQPGFEKSSSSLTAAAAGDVFERNFNGYYVYLVQNILQTPFQAVVKYDVYDPNTAVEKDQIGVAPVTGVSTGSADIKYSTLGFGVNYRFNSNLKILAYYDIVTNETTGKIKTASTLTTLAEDRKDNVFTLRCQYKF